MGLLVQEPALQKLIHHRLYLCQAVYLMKMDVLQDCVDVYKRQTTMIYAR